MSDNRKFIAILAKDFTEMYLGANARIVRWEPDFVTVPFKAHGDHFISLRPDDRHRYRGMCCEDGFLCAIWQPVAMAEAT